jgi:HK97 family phage prohead protease
MKYKGIMAPARIKADEEQRIIKGYASVFGVLDSYNEIVVQGAFEESIKEDFDRVKVLWNHSRLHPIGKPQVLKEDEHGLYFEAKISETPEGDKVLTLARDEVITDVSIGYEEQVIELDREGNEESKGLPIWYLKKLKLWEFSPVTWGANPAARITDVKSRFAAAKAFEEQRASAMANAQFDSMIKTTRQATNAARDLISKLSADKPRQSALERLLARIS